MLIRFKRFQDPDYIIIHRWVPPEEQKELWWMTKAIRDARERVPTTFQG